MTDPVLLLDDLSAPAACDGVAPRPEFRHALRDLLAHEVAVSPGASALVRRRRLIVLSIAACVAVLLVMLLRPAAIGPNVLETVDRPLDPTPTGPVLSPTPTASGPSAPVPAPVRAPTPTQRPGSTRTSAGAAPMATPPVASTAAPPSLSWAPDRFAYADQRDDAYPPYSSTKVPDATLSDDAADIVGISVRGMDRRTFEIELELAAPPRDAMNYWVSAYLDPAHGCYVFYFLDPGGTPEFNVMCANVGASQGSGDGIGTVQVDGSTLRATFTHPDSDETPDRIAADDTFYGFNARTCAGTTRNCTNANTFDEAKSSSSVRFRWR
jgi:hypothetical protein